MNTIYLILTNLQLVIQTFKAKSISIFIVFEKFQKMFCIKKTILKLPAIFETSGEYKQMFGPRSTFHIPFFTRF